MKMTLPFKPNAQNFSILMGLNMGAQLLCNTYSKAVVTQIEQRYGLSSKITGSLVTAKTTGGIVCLIFLSMYSQNIKNRPKTIALASCIAILGALLAPLPHLLGGKYNPGVTSNRMDSANTAQNVSNFDKSEIQNICVTEFDACDETDSNDVAYNAASKSVVYLFFLSEFMYGIGSSPIVPLAMPYLDDASASTGNSAKYFAFMMGLPPYGWIVSYFFAGQISNIYVDWPEEPPVGLTPEDDMWVGAWWLGYFIFSIVLLLFTIPIFYFPPRLTVENDENKEQTEEQIEFNAIRSLEIKQDEKYREEFREMTLSERAGKVLGNKLMMICMLGSTVSMYYNMAYLYYPKYLERQFNLTVEKANKLSVIPGPLYMIGTFLGGYVFSSMVGLNAWTARKPVVYVLWFSTVLAGFRMFIGCDQLNFRGYISETESFNWEDNCNCKEGKFDPVCDKLETSKAYVTACHAQCLDFTREPSSINTNITVYTNCVDNSTVSADYCETEVCDESQVWIYILGSIIVQFPQSFFTAPFMMIFLGTSPSSEKSVSLSIFKLVQKLGGGLYAGTAIGMVFDRACVLFGKDDCSNEGGCLLYDNVELRFNLFGYILGMSVISLVIWTFLLFVKPVKGSTMYREMEREQKGDTKPETRRPMITDEEIRLRSETMPLQNLDDSQESGTL